MAIAAALFVSGYRSKSRKLEVSNWNLKVEYSIIIFYSQCCEKIREDYIDMIEKSQCEFKTYKLTRTGKNALDFYIAVECRCLSASGVEQVCIVSRDKGFSAITDFFRIKSENENITVHVAPNIEKALSSLNAPEDVACRRTDIILKFIEKQDMKTPRILYTGSLHEFGREDGRGIYQMLKKAV